MTEKQTNYIQVEEFPIEEIFVGEDMSGEQLQEKRGKLLETLNLKKQKQMFAEDVGIPYQRLTRVGINVWSAFCPHKSKLTDFEGYIPTRVLEIIEKTTEQFGRIEVWSEEQTNPDPVLVGVVGKEYSVGQIYYLLARWGTSLLPYSEVVKLAREKWTSRRRNSLLAKQKQVEQGLASIDHEADQYFDGQSVFEIY